MLEKSYELIDTRINKTNKNLSYFDIYLIIFLIII